uniref:uncharacterized protein LOC122598333 isoform X2 n=1 Tax=Erigeron canadensis TaxID=72917 RepID=UPI001CB93EFE|nr:uncharacterized protein LOC122598333 isoform X2 [Erigeron canadensis]
MAKNQSRREEESDSFSAVNQPPPPTGDQPSHSTDSFALIHPYKTVIPPPYNPTSVPPPYNTYSSVAPPPYLTYYRPDVSLPYNNAIPSPHNTFYYTYSVINTYTTSVPPSYSSAPDNAAVLPPPVHNNGDTNARYEMRHRHPSGGQQSSTESAHDGTQTQQRFQRQWQESSTINDDRRFCDDMCKIGGIALAMSLSLYGIMATLMGQYSDSFMRQHMIAVGISVLALLYCCASGIAVLINYLRATEDPGNRSYIRFLICSCVYCAFFAPLLLGIEVFIQEDTKPVYYLIMAMIFIAVFTTCFSL